MSSKQSIRILSKFIAYILGRQPDEFGLIPDNDGFIKIKDLLKALSEEDGWRHVRRSHINEILYTASDPPFEIQDERIRAIDRDDLPRPTEANKPPKLLYTCVRRKAYPHVSERGISPLGHSQVILSSSRLMAERLGKRMDTTPVVLTIQVEKSVNQNVVFYQMGNTLFLSERIPPGCFSGPPLPKQKPEQKQNREPAQPSPDNLAGSFKLNVENIGRRSFGKGKKKEIAWKTGRKRMRRERKCQQ
jgi:putative RNA 2'-phosphotransferase